MARREAWDERGRQIAEAAMANSSQQRRAALAYHDQQRAKAATARFKLMKARSDLAAAELEERRAGYVTGSTSRVKLMHARWDLEAAELEERQGVYSMRMALEEVLVDSGGDCGQSPRDEHVRLEAKAEAAKIRQMQQEQKDFWADTGGQDAFDQVVQERAVY